MTEQEFLALMQPIIQAIIAGIGLLLTTLIGIYVPKAISAFEKRTKIVLTDQQRETVLGSAMTGAGILRTKLDQGVLKIGHISVNDPSVLMEAAAAIARVPEAASALNKNEASMAATIVGLVDTAPKPSEALVGSKPASVPGIPIAPYPLAPKATT